MWVDNIAFRSHRLLSKSLSARGGVPPYELLVREDPAILQFSSRFG